MKQVAHCGAAQDMGRAFSMPPLHPGLGPTTKFTPSYVTSEMAQFQHFGQSDDCIDLIDAPGHVCNDFLGQSQESSSMGSPRKRKLRHTLCAAAAQRSSTKKAQSRKTASRKQVRSSHELCRRRRRRRLVTNFVTFCRLRRNQAPKLGARCFAIGHMAEAADQGGVDAELRAGDAHPCVMRSR